MFLQSVWGKSIKVVLTLVLFAFGTVAGALGQSLQSQSITSRLFDLQMQAGVVVPAPWGEPWPTVSASGIRLSDTLTGWSQINTANGTYDFSELDAWLNQAQAHHQTVLYTFEKTPQWASSNPNDGTCKFWNPGECDPPSDLQPDGTGTDQYWKDFVTAIATHAAGRIAYWEIWNEAHNSFYWNGTVAQMLRMASDAYSIIKKIDPNALVTSPSSPNYVDASLDVWMTDYLAAGGGNYADIQTFHGYTLIGGCGNYPSPERLMPIVRTLQRILVKYGQGLKPLWDTEASWGPQADTCFYDQDLQAAFVARFYMIHWSVGVSRLYWFQYNSTTEGSLWSPAPYSCGGVTCYFAPGTLLEPGIAYQQVYNWMVGATMSQPCSASGTVWTCGFTRPNGYVARAVWDTSQTCSDGICTTAEYAVESQFTKYSTLSGETVNITGAAVPIGAKPILIENQ